MSTKAKFTPGPWKYEYENSECCGGGQWYSINSKDTVNILWFPYYSSSVREDEALANARLIAAAPLMMTGFEAIKHSIQQARIHGNDWKRELALIENIADRAITAATEETP